MWNEIAYLFTKFSGCIVDVWEWMSNFIPHFLMDIITMLGLKLNHVSKKGPGIMHLMDYVVDMAYVNSYSFSRCNPEEQRIFIFFF